jgi:hypothetical protein
MVIDMTTKFTPGPWEITRYDDENTTIQSTGPVHWIQPKHRPILPAAAITSGYSKGESEANAKLIAAAPDLLEAAQNLVNDMDKAESPERNYRQVNDLRKAITRATD